MDVLGYTSTAARGGRALVTYLVGPLYVALWLTAWATGFEGGAGMAAAWSALEATALMSALAEAADRLLSWAAADFPRRKRRAAVAAALSGVPVFLVAVRLEERWSAS